jgi:hypothetical protein
MEAGVEYVELTVESLTKNTDSREVTDWMLPLFWSLSRRIPGCVVGEIGMRGGTSTLAWCLGADLSDGHVWSMDIEPCEGTLQMLERLSFRPKRHSFVLGNSQTTDFPEGVYFDILYIDGDHSYEGVKGDYERHVQRLKDGGIVLLHDTMSWPEVGTFCDEIGAGRIDLGAGLGIIMPNGPRGLNYYTAENGGVDAPVGTALHKKYGLKEFQGGWI